MLLIKVEPKTYSMLLEGTTKGLCSFGEVVEVPEKRNEFFKIGDKVYFGDEKALIPFNDESDDLFFIEPLRCRLIERHD